LETAFGVREFPVETAAGLRAVIDRMVRDGTVPDIELWRALDMLATQGQW
jgi:hypothetical protein